MERLCRLYLVRHGQVMGHEEHHVYGHTDVAITEIGRIQMEHLAERLRFTELGAIYSSDLKRSILGARIVARYHDVPHHVLPDLREMSFGDWEGLTLSDIRARFSEQLLERQKHIVSFKPPGKGESIHELAQRVIGCFEKIMSENTGKNILLLGHGGVNRVILSHALGLDMSRLFHLHQDYGCLNIIDYFADSRLVRLING